SHSLQSIKIEVPFEMKDVGDEPHRRSSTNTDHAKILKYMWPYIKRYNNKKNEKEKINISEMNVDIEANISVRIKLGRFAP
ncbi:hypothetical protein ACJX0J_016040, partial [Zea mays]